MSEGIKKPDEGVIGSPPRPDLPPKAWLPPRTWLPPISLAVEPGLVSGCRAVAAILVAIPSGACHLMSAVAFGTAVVGAQPIWFAGADPRNVFFDHVVAGGCLLALGLIGLGISATLWIGSLPQKEREALVRWMAAGGHK